MPVNNHSDASDNPVVNQIMQRVQCLRWCRCPSSYSQ